MSFKRYAAVLRSLAQKGAGSTSGAVWQMNSAYSHTQIKKTLDDLVGEGMVRVEGIQYRPHIVAKVYHIQPAARSWVGMIADAYDAAELQKTMNFSTVLDLVELSEISTVRDGDK